MITLKKPVYYCEFCKRHRLSKASIERHEPKCIYNPLRLLCGWHEVRPPAPADFASLLKQELDVDWLRTEMEGCPACMLAVVVQAGLTLDERSDLGFDYKHEVERFREEERSHDYGF
jgi:hypothetical protein